MSSLKDKIHHAIYTDDETADSVTPTPAPAIEVHKPTTFDHNHPSDFKPSSWPAPPPIQSTGSQDELYEKVKKNTDFSYATSIQLLIKLQKPLENIITDPTTRLKAAYAQAKDQKSLGDGDIDHDLTKLSNLIEQELNKCHDLLQHEREGIASDETHATQLEQQLHDLRVSIADRKSKLDRADTGYSSAFARRKNDLAELTNQFSVLK